MATLLLNKDFTGRWNVSNNKFGEQDFEDYMEQLQPEILKDLMGCSLYALFEADLVAQPDGRYVPQSLEFLNIYDEICTTNTLTTCCTDKHKSYGMVDMLKCMIRFYWLRDQKYKQTVSGTSIMDSENSVVIKSTHYGLTKQFNRGIESYHSIQCYMHKHESDYPKYSPTKKELATWL
jgi:hypothetical protein